MLLLFIFLMQFCQNLYKNLYNILCVLFFSSLKVMKGFFYYMFGFEIYLYNDIIYDNNMVFVWKNSGENDNLN